MYEVIVCSISCHASEYGSNTHTKKPLKPCEMLLNKKQHGWDGIHLSAVVYFICIFYINK